MRSSVACCLLALLASPLPSRGGDLETLPELADRPLVTVQFDSDPKGAQVLVDNVPACRTPCYDRFPEGPHQVSMQAKWYLRNWEEVILKEGARIEFALKKKEHQVDALVIKSKQFALYDKAIDGFRKEFKGTVNVMTLGGLKEEAEGQLLTRVRTLNPRVILTVGLLASWLTMDLVHSVPIVFCMAIDSVDQRLNRETATGVHVEPAFEDQLKAVLSVLPRVRRIGVIYDPKRSGETVSVMLHIAQEQVVELIAVPVENREEVPAALGQVLEKAQALWLIRDSTVTTPKFVAHLFRLQLQKKLPLVAFSDQFVWHGALCSYSARYHQQGTRAAELANKILSGTDPKDIPTQHPKGTLFLNLQTAVNLHYLPPVLAEFLPEPVIKIDYR